MTSLLATESGTVVNERKSVLTFESDTIYDKHRQRRHILKSKENTYKHKCNKVIRRRLKKYKLRQDGTEDQDVLDVSKILVSSLIIKSPNSPKEPFRGETLRPKNYLFKMVRRDEAVKISKTLKNSNSEVVTIQNAIINSPLAISKQDKKQTNAFKLLMDSRNKSIGSNSPGKEKSDKLIDIEEVVEKKTMKAKRHLMLQKMAEAKGSLRNKEIEETQDKIIKKKMEKRAEKLKSMILKDSKSIKENEDSNDTMLKKTDDLKLCPKIQVEITNNNNSNKQIKTLKIVDIFNTIEEPINISPVKKILLKEDQEFLNKLSPSLKKKESMLSYFKKLEKDDECSPADSENDNIIKVKLQPRNKKKGKKKKLSLKRDTLATCDLIEINGENTKTSEEENKTSAESTTMNQKQLESSVIGDAEVKSERQKRKRNTKVDTKVNDSERNNAVVNNDSRPKRSVKRPVKYIDEACFSSSDEELHIFTPKKKKHIEIEADDKKPVNESKLLIDKLVKSKSEKKALKDISKKPAKLAPIFTPKQTDIAALEAKQKFLQSGVPEKLKKIIHQQKNNNTSDNSFPVVVHVQQRDIICEEGNKLSVNIPMMNMTEELCALTHKEGLFKNLLDLNIKLFAHNVDCKFKKSTQTLLQNIKKIHPKFPVYRTYRYLRSKGKGEFKDCNHVDVDNSIEIMNDLVDVFSDSPDRLNWTDKYKAMSTNQIIGNFESIKELKKWLISWTENELKSKPKSKPGSDSSDYYQSDTDSRDSMKSMNNLLILTGPTGCGKTASVYAVAAELAMKVIEVNASSKRTGKIMLQDLQEATQSHKVNRGTGSLDNSQKSQEKNKPEIAKNTKKRGRPKKSLNNEKLKKHSVKSEALSGASLSQESTRTDSSLILIDDADIVFEQDDGFSSAIVQLVQCSKRPVILITSSVACPHLQRFLQYGNILKMCPLLPRMLGTWLDIMCLADSGICWPGVGAKFLNHFKGDIRKTINYLQFYMSTYDVISDGEIASQNFDFYMTNIDDESSCMSWPDNEDSDVKGILVPANNEDTEINIWTDFVAKHSNLLNLTYPGQLFNIWWSMPLLLPTTNIVNSMKKVSENSQCKNGKVSLELEAMANAIDALSLSDYISHINPDTNSNITSQPWYYAEEHSVSERENLDYYIKEYEVTDEICHTMVTSSIATAQDVLGCDRKIEISSPGMTLHR